MADKEEPKKFDVKDDIAAMLDSLAGASDGPETEVKDEKAAEGDDTGKDEETPAEEETEEQKAEDEKKEEPVVEDKKEEPVVDDKDKIIADLRAKLAEKETKSEPKPEPKPEPTTPKIEDQDFVGETDLDELTRDKDTFNKLLNKIYQKAVTDTTASLSKTLPDLVKTNISIITKLQNASKQFYADNPDLNGFEKVVATVFEELAAAAPSKTYGELMAAVGPEVRKRLELPTPAKASAKAGEKDELKKPGPPKLPTKGAKSGRPSDKPALDTLQTELEEMNKVVRG